MGNSRLLRPTLFLDRDGIINIDKGYTHIWENVQFIDGIFDLVRFFNSKDFLVIIITNQSGIGREYFSVDAFHYFMKKLLNEFTKRDLRIDKYYFCPCNPQNGFCPNRKPEPGLFLKAKSDFDIDMDKSIMVGDNLSDMVAGQKSGITNLFLLDTTKKVYNPLFKKVNHLEAISNKYEKTEESTEK